MSQLSPDLYHLLDRRFGVVKVVNPGQPAVVMTGLSVTTGEPETVISEPGEQFVIRCPFCGDTSGHLYVSHLYGTEDPLTGRRRNHLFRCFRRECQGREWRLKDFEDLLYSTSPVRSYRVDNTAVRFEPWRPRAVQPSCTLRPLSQMLPSEPARTYLAGRGFDALELEKVWGVAYAAEPCYPAALSGRIFVPIRHDGIMVAYQGRWPGELDWKATGITKYYNLYGPWKSEVLYNLDLARQESCVVLVEGVFDVFGVGRPGVALLGKTLSRAQLSLLAARAANKPIVVLIDPPSKDADTVRAAADILAKLRGRFPGVVRLELPNGLDPGDCGSLRGPLWDFIETGCAEHGITLTRPDDYR